ncbi:hypothetical protein BJ944DRAFT_160285 [Cunninghamella echinulata]|nr:hypothetical protein BJ944DRAFT_160285 [Cunninghamella echinulata]
MIKQIFYIVFFLTSFIAAQNRGNYTVNGLGKRKQEILNNGGGIWDISIAMLETENLGTDYKYGDNKTYDAANFGIFKQGWFMLRTSVEEFKQYTKDDYNEGAILNRDLKRDIQARHESQNYFGTDKWFGGHRNGETGLNNPNTSDINDYKNGVNWIHDQLARDPKYLRDDTRFWIDVTPI